MTTETVFSVKLIGMLLGNRFGKDGFEQRSAGGAEEQSALLQIGEIHGRIADAQSLELCPEVGVAFEPETDMVDGLRKGGSRPMPFEPMMCTSGLPSA